MFCARPAENLNRVSFWGSAVLYYEPIELLNRLDGHKAKEIDWYALEEPWTHLQNEYPTTPQGDPIQTAQKLFQWILHKKR